MPVAAGVEGDGHVRAGVVLAAGDMAAERRRAAALDCAHHLQLVETDVSAVGFTPSGTVVAEDIRDLQSWPAHVGVVKNHFLPPGSRSGRWAGGLALPDTALHRDCRTRAERRRWAILAGAGPRPRRR